MWACWRSSLRGARVEYPAGVRRQRQGNRRRDHSGATWTPRSASRPHPCKEPLRVRIKIGCSLVSVLALMAVAANGQQASGDIAAPASPPRRDNARACFLGRRHGSRPQTPSPTPAPAAAAGPTPSHDAGAQPIGPGARRRFDLAAAGAQARSCVLPPSGFAGIAVWFNVRENGTALGKLSNGVYFVQVADPGTAHLHRSDREQERPAPRDRRRRDLLRQGLDPDGRPDRRSEHVAVRPAGFREGVQEDAPRQAARAGGHAGHSRETPSAEAEHRRDSSGDPFDRQSALRPGDQETCARNDGIKPCAPIR